MTGRRSSGSPKDRHRRKIQKKEKMSEPKYTIYWMDNHEPQYKQTPDMGYALKWMEYLRKNPKFSAICFCAENPNQVGKMGVDSIVDNKTPDGVEYTWVKRRDGGQ